MQHGCGLCYCSPLFRKNQGAHFSEKKEFLLHLETSLYERTHSPFFDLFSANPAFCMSEVVYIMRIIFFASDAFYSQVSRKIARRICSYAKNDDSKVQLLPKSVPFYFTERYGKGIVDV